MTPAPSLAFGRAVRLGASLRWRIARNRLRKGGIALFVLVVVVAALCGLGGLVLFASARAFGPEARRAVLVVSMSVLVLGWMFVPLAGGGADETVDPTRLALLPLRTRDLLAVLGASAATGPATLAVLLALLGVPVGYADGSVAGTLVVLVSVPVMFLLGLGLARVVAAVLVRTQRSRRGRDLAVLVSGAAGVSLWLASQAIGPLLAEGDGSAGETLVEVFAWLPPGWAARGVAAASEGRPAVGAAWVLAAAVLAAVALALWARLTERLLTAPERVIGSRAADDRPALGRARTPLGACLAKEARYLLRSPGKRVQFLLGTLMGVGFALIQLLQRTGPDRPELVFLGLTAALLSIGGSFNVIGFDSPSLWLEVVTGGPGRIALFARTAGWFPHLFVPSALAVVVIAVWTGEWSRVPMALALALCLAGCGLGVAAVVSVVAPVPYTDGDNPFSWRQGMNGKGCITGLYTLGGLVGVGLLAAPVVAPVVLGSDHAWAAAVAAAGPVWGAGCWWLGVRLGSRALDGRGPELVAELTSRALV